VLSQELDSRAPAGKRASLTAANAGRFVVHLTQHEWRGRTHQTRWACL
jgi:hypothetical protein